MTDVVGRLWQDGESLAKEKQYHEALLNYQRAKTLLIKESAAMFDGVQQKDKKASKLLGDIMEQLQTGISKITSTLASNHQLALGLSYGFSKTDVKKAYRKYALKYHPDKNADCDTTSIFTVIQAAYENLSSSAPTVGIADYKGGQQAEAKKPAASSRASTSTTSSSKSQSKPASGSSSRAPPEGPEPALGADYLRSILKKFGFPARHVDKYSYEELMMKYLACKAHIKAREAGDRSKPTFSGKARRQSSYAGAGAGAGDMEDDDSDSVRYGEFDARKNNKPYVPRSGPGEPYSHNNTPNLNPYYNQAQAAAAGRRKTQREMEDEEEEMLYSRRPRAEAGASGGEDGNVGNDSSSRASREKDRGAAARAKERASQQQQQQPSFSVNAAYISKERERLNEFRRKLDATYEANSEYSDFSDKRYQHKDKAQVPNFMKGGAAGGRAGAANPFNLPKQAPAGQSSFVYNKTPRGSNASSSNSDGGDDQHQQAKSSPRVPRSSSRSSKDKRTSASSSSSPDTLASNISVMGVGDLKRLMESKGISHEGCVEKIDLVEKLFAYFGIKAGTSAATGAGAGDGGTGSARAVKSTGIAGVPRRNNSVSANSNSSSNSSIKEPKTVSEASKFEFEHKPKEKTKASSADSNNSRNSNSSGYGYVPSSGASASKRNIRSNNSDSSSHQQQSGAGLYDRNISSDNGSGSGSNKGPPSVLDPSNLPPPVNNGLGHFVISTEKLREMEERLLGKGRHSKESSNSNNGSTAAAAYSRTPAPAPAPATTAERQGRDNNETTGQPPRAPVGREHISEAGHSSSSSSSGSGGTSGSNALFERLERIINDNTDPIHARPAPAQTTAAAHSHSKSTVDNRAQQPDINGWGYGLESDEDDDEDSFDRLLNPFYEKMGNPHPGFGQPVGKQQQQQQGQETSQGHGKPASVDGMFASSATATANATATTAAAANKFTRNHMGRYDSSGDDSDTDSAAFTSDSETNPSYGRRRGYDHAGGLAVAAEEEENGLHQSPFVVPSMEEILKSTRTAGAGELESDEEDEDEINYTGTHVKVGIAMSVGDDIEDDDDDVARESSPGTVNSRNSKDDIGMNSDSDLEEEEEEASGVHIGIGTGAKEEEEGDRYAYENVDESLAPPGSGTRTSGSSSRRRVPSSSSATATAAAVPVPVSYSMGVGTYADDDEELIADDDDEVIDELFLNNFKQQTSDSVNAANARVGSIFTSNSNGRGGGRSPRTSPETSRQTRHSPAVAVTVLKDDHHHLQHIDTEKAELTNNIKTSRGGGAGENYGQYSPAATFAWPSK